MTIATIKEDKDAKTFAVVAALVLMCAIGGWIASMGNHKSDETATNSAPGNYAPQAGQGESNPSTGGYSR